MDNISHKYKTTLLNTYSYFNYLENKNNKNNNNNNNKNNNNTKLLFRNMSITDMNNLIFNYLMDKLRNEANKLIQKIATPMMGVLKDSKFLQEGVLTPEEFVLAGDQLTHKCPTWR